MGRGAYDRRVKVSLGLPTHRVDRFDDLASASAIAELSAGAEAAGFDAVFVTEHPFPSDRWLATGGHHALDPFVALSFVAAATTRLRLQTNLVVAAYRNPFMLAKAVSTLDALSGGRVILGLGAGYLEPEFEALGAPFDERNDLTDESITAMRAAWTGRASRWTARTSTRPATRCCRSRRMPAVRRSGSAATRTVPSDARSSSVMAGHRSRIQRSQQRGDTRRRSRRSMTCERASITRTRMRKRSGAPTHSRSCSCRSASTCSRMLQSTSTRRSAA